MVTHIEQLDEFFMRADMERPSDVASKFFTARPSRVASHETEWRSDMSRDSSVDSRAQKMSSVLPVLMDEMM